MILNSPCPLLYSLTPPRQNQDATTLSNIASRQKERIKDLDIDGLILYDIQEEKSRTKVERPFPFLPTMDPFLYAETFLSDLKTPKVIYRCVGKHSRDDFSKWLQLMQSKSYHTVFVGAPSRSEDHSLSLQDAYQLSREIHPGLSLGGVAISERHRENASEHLRLFEKQKNGCSFFVTQAVYNVQISKDLLSDYYYTAKKEGKTLSPIIFTFSICGSLKTLGFMKWLGVNFPRWLENELENSQNIIDVSFDLCLNGIKELIELSRPKGIPIGFNIESVSIRKEEIDASIELVKAARKIIKSYG